jgi:hypothetical protein
VQVQQYAAVSSFGDLTDEPGVGEIAWNRTEIARRGLDKERPIELLDVGSDVGNRRLDNVGRRYRWQEIASMIAACARAVEREMLTPLGCVELTGGLGGGPDAVDLRWRRTAHRETDAVAEHRTFERAQPMQSPAIQLPAVACGVVPQSLRLDLDHVHEIVDARPHKVDTAGRDQPDAQVEAGPRDHQPSLTVSLAAPTGLTSPAGLTKKFSYCRNRNWIPDVHCGHPARSRRLACTFWNDSRSFMIVCGNSTLMTRGGSGCGLSSAIGSFLP